MKKSIFMCSSFILFGFMLLFLFPSASLAVDFSITNVEIEAKLMEDGDVIVKELHTYSFDGKFNGITRTVIPKEGATIKDFQAFEKGSQLKIEEEDHLYKIYRKGKDEIITITIQYTIENGVDVYKDIAEFYWPFFDERNESTYENMSITILPPKATDDVIAFGYDEAFKKEVVNKEGVVTFYMGEVPSGENGDIRVAYPSILFPSATVIRNERMGDILTAREELYEKAAVYENRRENLSSIASIIVPLLIIALVVFVIVAIWKSRTIRLDVMRQIESVFHIPKEILSIPATILFVKGIMNEKGMAASLLDLVRKGYVKKTGEMSFELQTTTKQPLLSHEEILVDFLFREVGNGHSFNFNQLEAYSKNKRKYEKFYSFKTKWNNALREEINKKNLYDHHPLLRILFCILSIGLLVLFILFATHELIGWFFISLILSIIYFILAIGYKTKNWDGYHITQQWKLLKEKMKSVSFKEWDSLTTDEQMRLYIYGLGANDKEIVARNEEFFKAFTTSYTSQFNNSHHTDLTTIMLIGPIASSHFHSANSNMEKFSSSSSQSSSGGGVGGGGGGSGAF